MWVQPKSLPAPNAGAATATASVGAVSTVVVDGEEFDQVVATFTDVALLTANAWYRVLVADGGVVWCNGLVKTSNDGAEDQAAVLSVTVAAGVIDLTITAAATGGGGGAVDSVNGETGVVVLDAADVGALATGARGVAGGVASLDGSATVPDIQIPASIARDTEVTAAAAAAAAARTAPVWQVENLLIGVTVEDLNGMFGWGAATSGRYADQHGVHAVDVTAETIGLVTAEPGAVVAADGWLDFGTGGSGGPDVWVFTGSGWARGSPGWAAQVSADAAQTAADAAQTAADAAQVDVRRLSREQLRAEWDQSTALVAVSHPTAASMDPTYDATWEISNGTSRGTIPHTPDGIDIQATFQLLAPYSDAELVAAGNPGQVWPHQTFRELLTLVRPSTSDDWFEWARLHPDATFGGLTAGEPAWFWESTQTGGAAEEPGVFADVGTDVGQPERARLTLDTSTATVTMWEWVPFDPGTPGVELSGGRWWVPVHSVTDAARFASMADPEVDEPANPVEPWRLGIQNRAMFADLRVTEFGSETVLAGFGPTELAAAGAGATSFVDAAGNTMSTTNGVIGYRRPADPPAAHVHAAGDIGSGTVATARLGSGTADSSTFLRGDQVWASPAVTPDPSDWHLVSDEVLASDGQFTALDLTGLTHIEVELSGRCADASATIGVRSRINGDNSSNYSINAASTTSAWNNNGSLPGSLTNTDRQGVWTVKLALGGVGRMTEGWCDNSYVGSNASTGVARATYSLHYWGTGSAITSMTVYPSSGDFAAGARLTLRGRAAP